MTIAQLPYVIRPIDDADLPGVIACLMRNFPDRDADYWRRGLERLARREPIADYPRFGQLLACEGKIVGVLLQIFSQRDGESEAIGRCNLSSYCVDAEYRSFAVSLHKRAIARKDVTFSNLSPTPRVQRSIAAFGFAKYARGQIVFAPLLSQGVRGARILRYAPDLPEAARLTPRERRLLADHATYDCLSFLGVAGARVEPLVFQPRRIGRNLAPALHVVHARDIDALADFSRAIGRRFLLSRPLCVVDANGPHRRLAGRYFDGLYARFAKGPRSPAPSDIAYTELVVFGR